MGRRVPRQRPAASALRARDHHLQGAQRVGEADHLDVDELRARAVRAHVVLAELLAPLRPHHPHRAVLLYGALKPLQPWKVTAIVHAYEDEIGLSPGAADGEV